MLAQFRQRYPQGSIISELIDIDHGKYIVRVSIQVEQITLATGLAAAETVELAEDRAENRALSRLKLEFTTDATALERSTENNSSPTTEEEQPASPSAYTPNQSSLPANTAPGGQRAIAPELNSGERLTTKSVKHEASTNGNRGQRRGESASPPSDIRAEEPAAVEEMVTDETAQLELGQTTPEPAAVEDNYTTDTTPELDQTTPEPAAVEEIVTNETAQLELGQTTPEPAAVEEITTTDTPQLELEQSKPETKTATSDTAPAQLDFHDVIGKTDIELKRLGWTTEQGRDYLIQTYGKRSRVYLTDDELLEFLHYLETLPSPG